MYDDGTVVLLRKLHPVEEDPVGCVPYLLGNGEMRSPDLPYGHSPALRNVPGGIVHALHEHLLGPLETVCLRQRDDQDRIGSDRDVDLQVRTFPRFLCKVVGDLVGSGKILTLGDLHLLVRKGDQCESGPARGLELPECIDIASRWTHMDMVVVDRDLLAHGPEGETLTYIR